MSLNKDKTHNHKQYITLSKENYLERNKMGNYNTHFIADNNLYILIHSTLKIILWKWGYKCCVVWDYIYYYFLALTNPTVQKYHCFISCKIWTCNSKDTRLKYEMDTLNVNSISSLIHFQTKWHHSAFSHEKVE